VAGSNPGFDRFGSRREERARVCIGFELRWHGFSRIILIENYCRYVYDGSAFFPSNSRCVESTAVRSGSATRRTRRTLVHHTDSIFCVSITAAARALEDEGETDDTRLLHDPLAKHLAGSVALRQATKRRARAPQGFDRKYMISRLAVRTRWFDDQLEECLGMPESYRSSPHRDHIVATAGTSASKSSSANTQRLPCQVVELGAGLSTRPWRLHLPASLKWFDVDRQDVIDVKEDLLMEHGAEVEIMSPMRRSHSKNSMLERQIGSLEGANHNSKSVEYPLRCDCRASVATDVGESSWMRALIEAGFDRNKPTVWIAEGLLMYLDTERVDALLKEVASLSAPGSCLLTAVVTESCLKKLAERRGKAKSTLMDEWKSGCPDDPTSWMAGLGWNALLSTTRAQIAAALRLPGEVCSFPTTDQDVPAGYFVTAVIS
jgi:O-methyltransferase involved in polyketide biosynthesis